MSPELFSQIVNIGLIVAFVLVIVFFLLAAWRGYRRGVWSMTFRFIFMSLFIFASIFILNPFSSLVSNIPLDVFGYKFLTITNTASGVSYNVPITTFGETLYEGFKGYYSIFNMSSTYFQAAEFAAAISSSIVKFTAFFILMIIVLTVGNILIVLLWHLCFKHIIPKLARRNFKAKWVALFENAILYVVCTFMLLSPVTSIINATNSAYRKTNQGASDSYIQYVDNFMNTYDNSLFAQVFFNWTTNEEGLTIDSAFIDAITSESLENGSISLVTSISELVEISAYFTNSITFGSDSITIDASLILDKEIVAALFDSIKSSNLITYLLPIAVEIALSFDEISQVVDSNYIDVNDINWGQEIDNIKEMYLALLDSGIIHDLTNNKDMDVNTILNSLLSEEKYPHIIKALKTIDNSKLLQRAFVSVLHQTIDKNETMKNYFPNSIDDLSDIRWGFELSVVYDNVYQIHQIEPTFIDVIVPKEEPQSSALAPRLEGEQENENESSESNTLNEVFEVILENIDEFQEVLIGRTNSDDTITDVDHNGRTIVYEDGQKIEGARYTLFDCQFAKYLLSSLQEPLSNLLGESETDTKVSDTFENLFDDNWRLNFKQEFVYMFQALKPFTGHFDVLEPVLAGEFPSDITEMDDDLVTCLSRSLPLIDRSDILTCVLYDTVIDAVESSQSMFTSFGLDYSLIETGMNVHKENRTLGRELAPIIASIKDIADISDILSSTSDTTQLINELGQIENNIKIARLLDTIYLSDILNYHTNDSNKDLNYFNLMKYVFDTIQVSGITFFDSDYAIFRSQNVNTKWHNTVDENGNYFIDVDDNPIYDGENGMFCNVIRAFSETGLLSAIINTPNFFDDNENFLKLAYTVSEGGYDLPRVLTSVGESKTFSYTMGTYLDSQLSMVVDTNVNVTFTNVTNWHQEGQNLKTILLAVGQAPDIKLNNLDFSAVKDIVGLNNILHALIRSTIFVDKNDPNPETNFRFGDWLYNKVQSSLSNLTDDSFSSDPSKTPYNLVKDPEDWDNTWGAQLSPTVDPNYSYNLLYLDMIYSNHNVRKTIHDWIGEDEEFYQLSPFNTESLKVGYTHYYDNPNFYNQYASYLHTDELSKLVEVIYWAGKALDSGDMMKMDETIFKGLLDSINQTNTLRVLLYNMYEIAKTSFGDTSGSSFIDFSPSFTVYLIDCGSGIWDFDDVTTGSNVIYGDRSNRQFEIDILTKLYSLYRFMEDSNILNGSTVNIDNITSTFTAKAKDALVNLNASNVFHRCGPYPGTGETTVFQNGIKSFLTNMDDIEDIIYSENSPKDQYYKLQGLYSNSAEKADYLVKTHFPHTGPDFEYQKQETMQLFEVMSSIVGGNIGETNDRYHGLTAVGGAITFNFQNVDLKDMDNVDAIMTTLELMNDSAILVDAVPNAVSIAFEENSAILTDSIPAGTTNHIHLEEANLYHNYFVKSGSGYIYDWNEKFTDEDFDTVFFILEQVSLHENDSADCLIPTTFDDISSFKVVSGVSEADHLSEFLEVISSSDIFHRSGVPFKVTSSEPFAFEYDDSNSLTVFQEIMLQFLDTSELEKIIFNANNPKDLAIYGGNFDQKINNLVKDVFPINESTSGTHTEINNIAEFLKAAAELDSLDFETIDIKTIDVDASIDVINMLNQSELLYDCVPNIVYMIFNGNTNSFDALTGTTSVDFTKASPFYVYHADSSPVWSNRYPDQEIEKLEDVMDAYLGLINHLGTDINTGNPRTLSDLKAIKDLIENGDIYNVLKAAYNSEVLHLENEHKNSDTETTVFEDIVRYFVQQSGITRYIHDDHHYDFATEGEYTIFKIKEISHYDFHPGSENTVGYHERWFTNNDSIGEIESLIEFIKVGIKQLDEAGAFDFRNIQFDEMAPLVCRDVMYAMNDCDLISDALPVFIKEGFSDQGINISHLTTYNDVDKTNYYLTQYEFGGSASMPNAEIETIYNALLNMATFDSNEHFVNYVSFGNIVDFVEEINNLDGVMAFVTNSKMFNNSWDIGSNLTVKTRGLLLHNILESVIYDSTNNLSLDNLVFGGDLKTKTFVLSQLFEIEDFDHNVESKGLFSLIKTNKTSIENISDSLSDVSTLGNKNAIVTALLKNSYNADGNGHRSYIVSELVSNLLNKILVEEEAELVSTFPTYPSLRYGLISHESVNKDAYNNDTRINNDGVYYSAINASEMEAIEGALLLEKIMQSLQTNITNGVILDADEIRLAFQKMGDRRICRTIYLAEIDAFMLLDPEMKAIRDTFIDDIVDPTSAFDFEDFGNAYADHLIAKGYAA